MVITTHMIHKITLVSKQESNKEIPKNPESAIFEAFLKNSDEHPSNQKVISSHS